MNLQDPITSLMTTELKTLNSEDPLQAAKDIFDEFGIHHIPVVDDEKLVGMLSKTDYLYFLKHYDPESREKYLNQIRLKNYQIKEVMTKRLVTLNIDAILKDALEIFAENIIHALPIMKKNALVGLVTSHDIIFRLLHPKKQISSKAS